MSLDEYQPRLACAEAWVDTQMPADQRTRIRLEPYAEMLGALASAFHRDWRHAGREQP